MSWLTDIATGLGTLLGVLARKTSEVIASVKESYNAYRNQGGATREEAQEEAHRRADALRAINEEMMDIRRRARQRGQATEDERGRWGDLNEQRDELKTAQDDVRAAHAAETIIDSEADIAKVGITEETVHIITANAFADVIGKTCPRCGRKMKLQWRRDNHAPKPTDLFWGCVGWYFSQGTRKRCTQTLALAAEDLGIMTDMSLPEFQLPTSEFVSILAVPGIQQIVEGRMDDLSSDLRARKAGVDIATCPVHGLALSLRKKAKPSGLMDMYFLACPLWRPNNEGCPFTEKLKSGSQLAALLKSQTGVGIL